MVYFLSANKVDNRWMAARSSIIIMILTKQGDGTAQENAGFSTNLQFYPLFFYCFFFYLNYIQCRTRSGSVVTFLARTNLKTMWSGKSKMIE